MGGMLGDVLSILLLCLVLAQFVALYLVYQRLSGAIVRSGAAQAAQADNTILQIESLLAGIECPTRVLFAEPAQPYLPHATRSRYAGALRTGEMFVLPGTHHLHMEAPAQVAAVVAGFLSDAACGGPDVSP